jgi:hypothetical protein
MTPIVQLAALLHDAHEAYTQDLAGPAKAAVNWLSGQSGGTSAWQIFETEHARNVRRRFGLLSTFAGHRYALRHFDLVALATERRDLTAWRVESNSPWASLADRTGHHIKPLDWISLGTPERTAMSWQDWRQLFHDRFDELQIALGVDLREDRAA